MNYFVRKAEKNDSRQILKIRNHPSNLKFFNNQERVLWENHNPWFEKKYFSGEDNYCFVLIYEEKLIGYCRYDKEDGDHIVSIALDPDYHGKGFGTKLLVSSLAELSVSGPIVAEAHKNNISSCKLFQKNNFKLFREDEKSYYFKYKL